MPARRGSRRGMTVELIANRRRLALLLTLRHQCIETTLFELISQYCASGAAHLRIIRTQPQEALDFLSLCPSGIFASRDPSLKRQHSKYAPRACPQPQSFSPAPGATRRLNRFLDRFACPPKAPQQEDGPGRTTGEVAVGGRMIFRAGEHRTRVFERSAREIFCRSRA